MRQVLILGNRFQKIKCSGTFILSSRYKITFSRCFKIVNVLCNSRDTNSSLKLHGVYFKFLYLNCM